MPPKVLPAFAMFMTMVAFTFVSCSQHPAALPEKTNAVTSAVQADTPTAPVIAALPDFKALVKKEGPAVINISTVKKMRAELKFSPFPGMTPDDPFYDFFRRFMPKEQLPHEFRSQTLGSGFIISQDGYILTNAHVVEDADEVTVRLTDQREFKAKVIGSDKRSDIAVMKIDAKDLPVVNIGSSSKLEVGEWVAAIGSPFGFTNSISQGIVSAKGRSLPGEDIVPFIQTDVPVNPGNSGGPLFNMKGEVVGINSQIYSRSGGYMGLSFAIPIDIAMKVKDELLQHGSVRRGRLGINIQGVSLEHAKSFDLDKAAGALVTSVEKGGPADRGGLEIGDIILKFDGTALASADDLVRAVAEAKPETTVKLQIWRNGAVRELVVRLGEADSDRSAKNQEPQSKATEPDHLGLAVRELDSNERRALQTEGFLRVEAVTGVAEESGIQTGDIIIAINSQRVSSIKQLRKVLDLTGKHAAILVQREGVMIFIPLKFKDE